MSEMQESPDFVTNRDAEGEQIVVFAAPCQCCDNAETLDCGYDVYTSTGYETWCIACVEDATFECCECGDRYDRNYSDCHFVDGYGKTCETCISNYYWWCEGCDEYRRNGNDCCDVDLVDDYLHNYGYKPDPVFHGASPIQFGIELECENINHNNHEAAAHFVRTVQESTAYLKEDGSLSGGLEIVTHPRDLESWREFAPGFLKVLAELNARGQRAWNRTNCGLHVHMSRAGMTPAHQTRFGLLFSRNELDWKEAARRSSGYANFNGLKSGGVPLKVLEPHTSSHSDAVNFGNEHTIEVRIFRPSFSLRWLGCIELVAAARDYTHGLTSFDVARGALDWPKFAQYVASGKFPHAARIISGEPFTGLKEVLPCA